MPSASRIHSIDILRGLVMVLMALDHVRDFFHDQAMLHDPLDLQSTTPLLYFTRWITHFCAPVFIFLSGTSAFLSGRNKSKKQLSFFLFSRGLWLILAELFIIGPGWTFDPFYHMFALQVIWAIGISMVVLSLMVWLPDVAILIFGVLIVCGHNLLDPVEASHHGPFGFWWDLLHHGNFAFYPMGEGHALAIFYPFLPWTGVMCLGYVSGRLFTPEFTEARRKRLLIGIGTTLVLLFVVLRFMNIYGDPKPWSMQKNMLYSFLSFIKLSKYPPSLLYLCMTIGPALWLLVLTEHLRGWWTERLQLFGRVAFFYYLLHIYLIHLLCVLLFFAQGYSAAEIHSPNSPFLFRPPQMGVLLPWVFVIWGLVILLMYPLCRKYDIYKRQHTKWWLSYL